jgi:hypothetical protein
MVRARLACGDPEIVLVAEARIASSGAVGGAQNGQARQRGFDDLRVVYEVHAVATTDLHAEEVTRPILACEE